MIFYEIRQKRMKLHNEGNEFLASLGIMQLKNQDHHS